MDLTDLLFLLAMTSSAGEGVVGRDLNLVYECHIVEGPGSLN